MYNSYSDFLSNAPLYQKAIFPAAGFQVKNFNRIGFSFYCDNCDDFTTFSVEFVGELMQPEHSAIFFPCEGKCQMCKVSAVIIHLKSELKAELDEYNVEILKVGQWPAPSIVPDKLINQYLSVEDKGFYKKALLCLSQNYGIAAYAYFRRIIENELRKIYNEATKQELPELELSDTQARTITEMIENSFQFMPESLKMGDNPIKFLWDQLSDGLHGKSDDYCTDQSKKVEKVLKFVIHKLSEEETLVKEIRQIISKNK